MDNTQTVFDSKDWKRKLADHMREHPDLKELPSKTAIYSSNGGDIRKVKIEEKEIKI